MNLTKKLFGGFVAVAFGTGLAIVATFAQSVWTGPTSAPPQGNVPTPLNVGATGQQKAGGLILNTGGAPTGLIVDKGNVGIGTTNPTAKLSVNGTINALGNIITGVADPMAPPDAVNLNYLNRALAQPLPSSGGKPVITIYGISGTPVSWAEFSGNVGATIKSCLFGTGKNCTIGTISAAPIAGTGASCPIGWSTVFSGYGPYAFMLRQNFYFSSQPNGPMRAADSNGPVEPDEIPRIDGTIPPMQVTYSVCGNSPFLVGQVDYTSYDRLNGANSGIGAAAAILSACAPQPSGLVCNTCQICQQNP